MNSGPSRLFFFLLQAVVIRWWLLLCFLEGHGEGRIGELQPFVLLVGRLLVLFVALARAASAAASLLGLGEAVVHQLGIVLAASHSQGLATKAALVHH